MRQKYHTVASTRSSLMHTTSGSEFLVYLTLKYEKSATKDLRMLQRDDIKAIYDKVGERQDRGAYYEDAAIADMLAHANLEQARRVVEVGSGTGRVASRMLGAYLNPDATYYALDLSSTMVRLTYARLAAWAKRVLVMRTDSIPNTPIADHSVDRFIALYVFDLLPPQDIQHMLAQAHRVLRPDGRLCLVSLTYGATPYARLKSWGWQLRLCPTSANTGRL